MKKLLALLVIIMLTASIVVAVENPFNFSLYNQIKLKAVDESQMGRKNSEDDYISDSPQYDFNVTKANLNDEMKCSASITIAEIYTLGFSLKGVGEIGFGGDAQRVEFTAGWENGIQAVQDYLKIDINAEWIIRWESRQADIAVTEDAVNFDANGDGDTADTISTVTSGDSGQHVDYLLKPSLKFSGSVPDSGFSWALSETVELKWNPENWKDSNPTYETYDNDEYDSNTGQAIHGDQGTFEYAKFETKLELNFEFFHFFAPENITGTIKLANNFKAKLPYSYYLEICKELNDEFDAGFELGLAGPTVYLGLWGETADFLNTSAPLNGDNGSYGSWDGTWIGTSSDKEEAVSRAADGLDLWTEGDFSDMDATFHGRPNLKLGFKINFSYTKDWFSFGTEYKGYADGLRKYDEDGCNDLLKWVNEFSIFAKFAL
jgi:hypothetical protein